MQHRHVEKISGRPHGKGRSKQRLAHVAGHWFIESSKFYSFNTPKSWILSKHFVFNSLVFFLSLITFCVAFFFSVADGNSNDCGCGRVIQRLRFDFAAVATAVSLLLWFVCCVLASLHIGSVWFHSVRFGLVWLGLVWFGCLSFTWLHLAWLYFAWLYSAWLCFSALLFASDRLGLVWFGLVWFGLVWFGLV